MSFPFNSAEVLGLLGYSTGNKNSVYIKCPFCRSKNKPLNINLENGVYRCNKNPEHHGNILTFYRDLMGMADNKTAYADICEKLKITGRKPITSSDKTNQTLYKDHSLDIKKTDMVYRRLLQKSYLSAKNKQNLLERGFTEEDLLKLQYKTLPKRNGKEIYEFVKSLSISDLSDVPGFFLSAHNAWMLFHGKPGSMVPYHSFNNKIHGMSIRKDDDEREIDEDGILENKFYYLSSRHFKCGTKANQCFHYAGEFIKDNNGNEKLNVPNGILVFTEGGMKADLFYCLTKQPAMASPGVNCLKILEKELPLLKENGIHTILMGYDMDRVLNINVLEALENVIKLIRSYGITCRNLQWETEYLTQAGDKGTLNVDKTFIFTVETYDNAMQQDTLEKTVERVKNCGRTRIMFALQGKEEDTEDNYKKYRYLSDICKNYNFIECSKIYWKLNLKGIDNLYAYKMKGIKS